MVCIISEIKLAKTDQVLVFKTVKKWIIKSR